MIDYVPQNDKKDYDEIKKTSRENEWRTLEVRVTHHPVEKLLRALVVDSACFRELSSSQIVRDPL
jgi:hypothetical protein